MSILTPEVDEWIFRISHIPPPLTLLPGLFAPAFVRPRSVTLFYGPPFFAQVPSFLSSEWSNSERRADKN